MTFISDIPSRIEEWVIKIDPQLREEARSISESYAAVNAWAGDMADWQRMVTWISLGARYDAEEWLIEEMGVLSTFFRYLDSRYRIQSYIVFGSDALSRLTSRLVSNLDALWIENTTEFLVPLAGLYFGNRSAYSSWDMNGSCIEPWEMRMPRVMDPILKKKLVDLCLKEDLLDAEDFISKHVQ